MNSNIIWMNWLVNLSGHPDSFCGVNWLVKLNNLYTKVSKYLIVYGPSQKVIHAGDSSNHTINHIIKEFPFIELYRECHMAVSQTIRHAPPNMKLTF